MFVIKWVRLSSDATESQFSLNFPEFEANCRCSEGDSLCRPPGWAVMTLYMKHKYYPRHSSSCLCSPWPRIFPSSPRLHNKLNPPDCDCWLSVDLCDIFRCLLSLNSFHPNMWDVNSDKCQPFQQIFWIVSPGNSLDNLWGAAGIETTWDICDMRHFRVHWVGGHRNGGPFVWMQFAF